MTSRKFGVHHFNNVLNSHGLDYFNTQIDDFVRRSLAGLLKMRRPDAVGISTRLAQRLLLDDIFPVRREKSGKHLIQREEMIANVYPDTLADIAGSLLCDDAFTL